MRKAFPKIEEDESGQSAQAIAYVNADDEKQRRAIIKEHLAENMGERDPNTKRVKKDEKKFGMNK